MRAGRLKSLGLWIYGIAITANLCLKAVLKSFFFKLDRAWILKQINNWVLAILKPINVKIEVKNPHKVNLTPGKPYILMPNHASHLDIPISFYAFPEASIRMLAKKELSYIPILNRAMIKAEFPFVDRKNREQAIKDLAYAKTLMEKGIVLWIAPEGTRSKTGELQPFKKGGFITAIQSKATIIPLMIDGAYQILPKTGYRLLLNQTVTVHIGEPVDASLYPLDKKEELISSVREQMVNLSSPQQPQKKT